MASVRTLLVGLFLMGSCGRNGLGIKMPQDAGIAGSGDDAIATGGTQTAGDTGNGGVGGTFGPKDTGTIRSTTSDASPSGGTTGDASGRVNVAFNYSPPSFIGVDCTEHAPRDPVEVGVNVVFSPSEGESPDSVTFPAARIQFTNTSNALTWTFKVMTEPFSVDPMLVDKSMWKVADSGSGQGRGVPCDYCDTMAEFDLQVVTPGQSPYWVMGLSPVQCQR
jgi:hypothetical protein